jgi:hypothetical protein
MKYLGDLASKVKVRINNINIIFVYTIMPKLCDFETCRKQASYGDFYGQPIRCKLHKEDSQRLVSQLCREGNCRIYSCYSFENEKKPHFCFNHKKDGMINVVTNTCKKVGCNIIPVFNYIGETTAIYCKKHQLEGMVNIKSRFCKETNCNRQPNFNFKGETKGIYCSQHKKENMVNVTIITCLEIGCDKIPSCGFINEKKRLYCSDHKLEGMTSLTNEICQKQNCLITATYNFINEKKPIYCSTHRLDNMVDITHKNCKANFCLGTRGNPKYKGHCSACYQQLFPSDPLTFQIRSKTKEIAVRDFINANFEGFHHDKPLWTGNCDCTHRRRIDHRKLIGNTLLCIETDENQHKNYNEKDEEIRYDDLFMLHGGKFIYIRFNPDKFKDKNGKSVNPMLYTRLPVLKKEIEKQIKRIENDENSELLEIIKLYYNE